MTTTISMTTGRGALALLAGLCTLASACGAGPAGGSEVQVRAIEYWDGISNPIEVPANGTAESHVPAAELASLLRDVDHLSALASGLSKVADIVKGVQDILDFVGILPKREVDFAGEFASLHAHIDDWGIAAENEDRIRAREARIVLMDSAMDDLEELVRLRPALDFDRSPLSNQEANHLTDADRESRDAADGAAQQSPFFRKYNQAAVAGEWLNFIHHPTPPPGSLVYDWRMGVGDMLHLIAQRLAIMGATDSRMAFNQHFHLELTRLRKLVRENYVQMYSGIECTHDLGASVTVLCADVYSGTSAKIWFPSDGCYRPDGGALTTSCAARIEREKVRVMQLVRSRMPLYVMRTLIDRMYTLLAPAAPLERPRFRLADGPTHEGGMCLGVKERWRDEETQEFVAVMEPCGDQYWSYDRDLGLVRDAEDRCLTSAALDGRTTSAPVSLQPCSGGIEQRWTYDPEARILQSALNTVLAIPSDSWVPPGTPVLTVDPVGDHTQQWSLEEGSVGNPPPHAPGGGRGL
jgi:hypothetical protein